MCRYASPHDMTTCMNVFPSAPAVRAGKKVSCGRQLARLRAAGRSNQPVLTGWHVRPLPAQIQKQLLPAKSASDLVIFYYNVWKTRGTPRARAWWHAVEEVRGCAIVGRAEPLS